jgi:Ser/Thr protein kinase RdoA (MazF antagonist)
LKQWGATTENLHTAGWKMHSASLEQIADILKFWGISGENVRHTSNSSWNVGGKFVLQFVPSMQHQLRKIRLANLLIEAGIPAAVYVKTAQGELTTPDGAYTLMEMLAGEHINFYDSPDLMHELGRGLAQLHIALSKLEPQLQCSDNDFYAEWKNYIKPGLVGVSAEIINHTEAKLATTYEKLPRCPIHRDVHAQNVLFLGNKISGWLDFELSRKDARIFDLAYLLAGLLVGHTKNPANQATWKHLYRNAIRGYNEVSPLTPEETTTLPHLMIAIELLFVTYWNTANNAPERTKAAELAAWLHTTPL